MYGSVVIITQNLAVSGANQILVNLIRGRFIGAHFMVLSPSTGPLDRIFGQAGAAVLVGDVAKNLHSISDIRFVICNTIMTAHVVLHLSSRRIPHVWILHEWWTKDIIHVELANRMLTHLSSSTIDRALQECHHVVCVCDSQRGVYAIDSPSSVVYVGVPSPPTVVRIADEKRLRFLYMGIVCPRKNQLKAIELFKRFAGERMDVSLIIVGARHSRDYEKIYLDQVIAAANADPRIFVHEVTNDPWSYYKAADVLLLCSLNEVTPLVLCEAMLSGVPVITTAVAGIPEMLENGRHGFVVPPDDDGAFIASMHTLAQDQALRQRLGEQGRRHALKKFSLDRMVRDYALLARSVSPITVLVDMDGVLVDWDAGFRAVWQDRSPITRTASYIMQECVPASFKAAATAVSRAPGFFASLPPAVGGIAALNQLASLPGFSVHICTAPLWANPTCVPDKLDWIKQHLGEEWLKKTIMTHDKTTVRGDVLIDDKPDITGAQHPTWVQAVFHQPYNAHLCKEQFKYRMHCWEDEMQWKCMLLRLLRNIGHRMEPEDLGISAESLKAHDGVGQYRKEYKEWRNGAAKGANEKRLSDGSDGAVSDLSRGFSLSSDGSGAPQSPTIQLIRRQNGQFDLCEKRNELDGLLLEQAVMDCDEFEEIFIFRKQYRDWRLGSPRGARNSHF